MGGMPGPLDPLELALLLEAAEDVSGLDRDERSSGDEADDDDETTGSPEMPRPRQVLAWATPKFVPATEAADMRQRGVGWPR